MRGDIPIPLVLDGVPEETSGHVHDQAVAMPQSQAIEVCFMIIPFASYSFHHKDHRVIGSQAAPVHRLLIPFAGC